MKCDCRIQGSTVIDSRKKKGGVYRSRKCKVCQSTFPTFEVKLKSQKYGCVNEFLAKLNREELYTGKILELLEALS